MKTEADYLMDIERVRKQRNDYQRELIELRKNIENGKFPTREHLMAHGHSFRRYLFDNEYAEEMICRCGYVIPPCYKEQDVTEFMETNGGIVKCPHSKKLKTLIQKTTNP